MKRILLAAIVLATCAGASGNYSVANEGQWPKTWPAELEPLRKQARTAVGPEVENRHYDIPFTKREAFEAEWPQLLDVKSKGAPIILLRAPNEWLGNTIKAGVRVHTPPEGPKNPEKAIPGQQYVRLEWMNTTFIELIVDGDVVDLNRIALPAETPVIDERFKAESQPPASRP